MKFSIITPSYGQGQYIAQNIESVLNQNWEDIEHIVVDGGSQDNTVAILKKYHHLKWVSEKDEGQADALSKGLAMSVGDIVGWINSDDYYNPDIFGAVAKCFEDSAIQWVIGDLSLLDERSGEMIPLKSPVVSFKNLLANPDIVRQQATFFRRSFLQSVGGWDKRYYMVMDFDLWIRLAKVSRPLMLDHQLAVFRIQEDQKTSLGNLHRQTNELIGILKREGAPLTYRMRLRLKKEWFWIKGFIKSSLIRCGLIDIKYVHRPMRGWRES